MINPPGCTDETACNYYPDAVNDDGSCEYEFDCAGECGGDAVHDCTGICGGSSVCYNFVEILKIQIISIDNYSSYDILLSGSPDPYARFYQESSYSTSYTYNEVSSFPLDIFFPNQIYIDDFNLELKIQLRDDDGPLGTEYMTQSQYFTLNQYLNTSSNNLSTIIFTVSNAEFKLFLQWYE